MSQSEHVHAGQILDSRGNPTVEVELSLRSGVVGPRGGSVEARRPRRVPKATELRDGGSDWMGKGVTKAS